MFFLREGLGSSSLLSPPPPPGANVFHFHVPLLHSPQRNFLSFETLGIPAELGKPGSPPGRPLNLGSARGNVPPGPLPPRLNGTQPTPATEPPAVPQPTAAPPSAVSQQQPPGSAVSYRRGSGARLGGLPAPARPRALPTLALPALPRSLF